MLTQIIEHYLAWTLENRQELEHIS